ncbi:Equilibrative nucleoside transporter [Dillenia turbinata]|uniref:Equilibrative nucleoside transporter n=1 Tax=Dillenia turbinata TaxID=194707 RepID=A0AAN8UUD6_9MAGN
MAVSSTGGDSESAGLLQTDKNVPKDSFHLAYIIYFALGAGYLLPWNAFITAVDYFDYIYPDVSVDRIFAVVYMVVALIGLLFIVVYAERSNPHVRINVGLGAFVVSLLVVPVMDAVYIKGQTGLYSGFYVTIGAVVLSGAGDALVQGGIIGSAGELPERYMQAVVAGTAASVKCDLGILDFEGFGFVCGDFVSLDDALIRVLEFKGVLVSFLRIFTKAVYSQDAQGLRSSALLYFSVSIVFMAVCVVLYNVAPKLPIIKHYQELKMQAVNEEKEEQALKSRSVWRSSLLDIVGRTKRYGFGVLLIYVVTLSIFPGYVTEDVYSPTLKDWYAIILITGYNLFDLIGKCLTAVYLLENEKVAIGATVARFLFYPLFYLCLHGPSIFRTEIPVTILTCLLGVTNGYFTSVLMILAPKVVPLQHAETAGIVIVLFLVVGLAIGSVVAWFWVV